MNAPIDLLRVHHSHTIANDTESIEQWLDHWFRPVHLAIELTNTYHLPSRTRRLGEASKSTW